MKAVFACCLVFMVGGALFGSGVPIRKSGLLGTAGGDGTRGYDPLSDEAPFRARITEKPLSLWPEVRMPRPSNVSDEVWAEIQNESAAFRNRAIPVDAYQLAGQVGEYVGWFGIVRGAEFSEQAGETRLLLEHKYFDNLTDLRLHVVSLYGAGDFAVTIPRRIDEDEISPLSLVCVYGPVAADANGRVSIKADYIRVWDWGRFTFMDYGVDKSNSTWVALRKVTGSRVYDSEVSLKYYEDRLGPRSPQRVPVGE